MIPIKFPESNFTYGEGQEEYLPLPCHREKHPEGATVSCWQLSWRERIKLLVTGKLWHVQLTFNQRMQPIKPQADKPDFSLSWNEEDERS